jgi:membrane protease subunit (stomatin/prohibitin family)
MRSVKPFFNERTPFPAEVYFVSMKEFIDHKWGTPQPIIVRNPGLGLGLALLQGFGTYSFQVKDPQQFINQVVGAQGIYRTSEIEARLRAMLLSKLQDLLGETAATNSVPELIGLTEELGAGVRAKTVDDFAALGLTLKDILYRESEAINKICRGTCVQWVCWIWRPIHSCRLRMHCEMQPKIQVGVRA